MPGPVTTMPTMLNAGVPAVASAPAPSLLDQLNTLVDTPDNLVAPSEWTLPTEPTPIVPRFPMFAQDRRTNAGPGTVTGGGGLGPGAATAPKPGDEVVVLDTPDGPDGTGVPADPNAAPAAAGAEHVGGDVGRNDGFIPAPGSSHLEIGGLQFNLYGGLIAAGGIAGGAVALHAMKTAGVKTAGIGKVLGPAVVAGLVGARLYHVATQWDYYKDHKNEIPKMWEGGMAIYGGLMAGTAVGAILAHKYHLPIAPLLDAAAIGLPLAQAVGRWGNYANQELFGKPTDKPWGLQVDPEFRPDEYKDRNSFHPTFLYESLWNVGLAVGTFALSKTWKGRPPGMLFATYLGGYAVGRFVIEGIRTDQSKEFAGLRTNQWTSLGMLGAAGAGALLLARHARG
ncbi:MAG: Prolipoprotein diacylglyceryl transferase [Thermoleophilia bacterium]|nr:Prolipoprotein diacylglyceryl transferase [Thermoleophilia bacterium]